MEINNPMVITTMTISVSRGFHSNKQGRRSSFNSFILKCSRFTFSVNSHVIHARVFVSILSVQQKVHYMFRLAISYLCFAGAVPWTARTRFVCCGATTFENEIQIFQNKLNTKNFIGNAAQSKNHLVVQCK